MVPIEVEPQLTFVLSLQFSSARQPSLPTAAVVPANATEPAKKSDASQGAVVLERSMAVPRAFRLVHVIGVDHRARSRHSSAP